MEKLVIGRHSSVHVDASVNKLWIIKKPESESQGKVGSGKEEESFLKREGVEVPIAWFDPPDWLNQDDVIYLITKEKVDFKHRKKFITTLRYLVC